MLKIFAIILAASTAAHAETFYDDRDLSGGVSPQAVQSALYQEGRLEKGTLIFKAQRISVRSSTRRDLPAEKSIYGNFMLTDAQGKDIPARLAQVLLIGPSGTAASATADASGRWMLTPPAQASGNYVIRFVLDNSYWKFRPSGNQEYAWNGPAVSLPLNAAMDTGIYRLDPASVNGQAGFIHQTFLEALDFFEKNRIGLSWWSRNLAVVWPGSGDYYTGYSVNLTNARAWDVNLHELGHFVVDMSIPSAPGGGQHKIDECYSERLAWTEGFPTFFAAAAHLDLSDPDAKFEYLVPRRAPIRIENVPDDVCQGERNEWRVAAGLWDLADTHADGQDHLSIGIQRLWTSIAFQKNEYLRGFQDAWNLLKKNLNEEEISAGEKTLAQNTIGKTTILFAAP